jgi:C-terminal processing protease CtpA/Prc
VRVSEIVPGSAADVSGEITQGDILVSVDGQNVQSFTKAEVGDLRSSSEVWGLHGTRLSTLAD